MDHTISARDIRKICGLGDYASRPILSDPALKPIKRSGPKGGNGLRFYRLADLLRILRRCDFFTQAMQDALCALDIQRRNGTHA
ncbi:MAG: hypothetical protein AAFQ79_05255 [Pseudomonadota bacterium]